MGTASEAINALPLPEADRARFVTHIAVADAVCYIFGALGVILFCSVAGPRLLGVDLTAEALKLERELGITRTAAGVSSAWRRFELRAYRIAENAPIVGVSMIAAGSEVSRARAFHSAPSTGGRYPRAVAGGPGQPWGYRCRVGSAGGAD